MTRIQTIKRLAAELATALNKHEDISLIEQYIQMALVSETERLKGKIYIYQKIHKATGEVLGEYWGMDEIVSEFKKHEPLTVKRLINGAIAGEKRSAYGYMWKRT